MKLGEALLAIGAGAYLFRSGSQSWGFLLIFFGVLLLLAGVVAPYLGQRPSLAILSDPALRVKGIILAMWTGIIVLSVLDLVGVTRGGVEGGVLGLVGAIVMVPLFFWERLWP